MLVPAVHQWQECVAKTKIQLLFELIKQTINPSVTKQVDERSVFLARCAALGATGMLQWKLKNNGVPLAGTGRGGVAQARLVTRRQQGQDECMGRDCPRLAVVWCMTCVRPRRSTARQHEIYLFVQPIGAQFGQRPQ